MLRTLNTTVVHSKVRSLYTPQDLIPLSPIKFAWVDGEKIFILSSTEVILPYIPDVNSALFNLFEEKIMEEYKQKYENHTVVGFFNDTGFNFIFDLTTNKQVYALSLVPPNNYKTVFGVGTGKDGNLIPFRVNCFEGLQNVVYCLQELEQLISQPELNTSFLIKLWMEYRGRKIGDWLERDIVLIIKRNSLVRLVK
jgi:hypothetical protein